MLSGNQTKKINPQEKKVLEKKYQKKKGNNT